MRLRTIQHPSEIDHLLHSYIQGLMQRLPTSMFRVQSRRDLPPALQVVVRKHEQNDLAWAAWSDQRKMWLWSAEMCLESSRERGRPVLRISLFNDGGRQLQSGLWMTDKAGAWHKCSS